MKIFITIMITIILIAGFITLRSHEDKVQGCNGKWVDVTSSVVVDVSGATIEIVNRVCQGNKP